MVFSGKFLIVVSGSRAALLIRRPTSWPDLRGASRHMVLKTVEDSDALFAFLQSQPAVAQANMPQQLRWPYNTRPFGMPPYQMVLSDGEI